MTVRFLEAGDAALVVEFGERIDRELNDRVLRLSALLRASVTPGVLETVPTYRSLMVLYDPLVTNRPRLTSKIESLLEDRGSTTAPRKLWHIPVCYAQAHAPDLDEVAQRTGLTSDEVIRRHRATRFHVYMIGFVPGFAYMGDLPDALVLPRRTDPRVQVPAGSLAIAMNMTAIYPVASPGGWHLIGATPIRLFDVRWPQPSLLNPGDAVQFESVTSAEFAQIAAAVDREEYDVPSEQIAV
jgi:KipI family sensor histidine kinase inhibitor